MLERFVDQPARLMCAMNYFAPGATLNENCASQITIRSFPRFFCTLNGWWEIGLNNCCISPLKWYIYE